MHIREPILNKKSTKEGGKIDTQKEFKKIGTHNGRFHADEVMATAVLKEIFRIELVRTRDEEILNGLDIVYDVGGGEFDHHDVEKKYRENGIPFAACGLIWDRFGKDVIISKSQDLTDEEVEKLFKYIDKVLMEGIDALDNGIRSNGEDIHVMRITSIISGFNPPWYSEKNEDEAFNEAVDVASAILKNTISQKLSVIKSREIVEEAYQNRSIPEVLFLKLYCPYGEALKEIDKDKEVLYAIYERKGNYAIQTVRDAGFRDRKKLPNSWAGKRDEELAAITGVEDAVFCHPGRFIAAAGSVEGIMKMARLAISEPVEKRKTRGKLYGFLSRLFLRK